MTYADPEEAMQSLMGHTLVDFGSEEQMHHITLDDGREVSTPRVRRATGHSDTPLAAHELRGKFLGCTRHARLPDADAQRLFDAMQGIDRLRGVEDIGWLS